MKASYYFLIFLLIGMINLSCSFYNNKAVNNSIASPDNTNQQQYIDLGIIFTDTTNIDFMYSFLNGLHVKYSNINYGKTFEIYMRVDSGNYSDYLSAFLKDSSVASDMQGNSLYFPDTSKYILVTFKDYYSNQSNHNALNLINSTGKLTVLNTFVPLRDAEITVLTTQEKIWIDSLKTFSFIKQINLPVQAYPE